PGAPMAQEQQEVAPKARGAQGAGKKKKKKSQPGRYSQLVVDTIRKLGERNGSSLAKIYSEAKKVSWFDQQNGRTYLKYSIRALVQNDTLLQVRGTGANGSFRLNKKKLEGLPSPEPKKKTPARAAPPAKSKAKSSPKKSKARPKKTDKPKKAPKSPARSPKKKAAASPASKKAKKTTKSRAKKA
uniref:H1.10 linker histone n=1 Tax=Leptobrachium leishanense TaxID=445787 RepID=A0A8C5W630_9ANUR